MPITATGRSDVVAFAAHPSAPSRASPPAKGDSMLNLRITPAYCVALYCLTALSHTLHEFTHHLVGRAVCGSWGTMTFNVFSLSCGTEPYIYVATYAGPAFTFALLWIGASLLLSP